MSDADETQWDPMGLTDAGHNFLDKARKPEVWEEAKAVAKEKTGGVALDVLSSVLTQIVARGLGL